MPTKALYEHIYIYNCVYKALCNFIKPCKVLEPNENQALLGKAKMFLGKTKLGLKTYIYIYIYTENSLQLFKTNG